MENEKEVTNKEYVGMWLKKDKNGNDYLSGSNEKNLFFVFRDSKDSTKKTIHSKDLFDADADLTKLGTLENVEGSEGTYQKFKNMYIFVNNQKNNTQ